MFKVKPVRVESITASASAFLLIGFNAPLWHHLYQVAGAHGAGTLSSLVLGLMIACAFNIFLTLLAFPKVLKPVLIALFMISAGVSYFMSRYGVLIDVGMLRNVMETNVAEVRDLLSPLFFFYTIALGVLPSLLLYKTPVHYRRFKGALISKTLACVGSATLIAALALFNYQGLSSLFRNHHELRLMVIPSNYIGASISYLSEQMATARAPFLPIAEDAVRTTQAALPSRKSLTVLVVGESARAENFGVLGYPRNTTPQLSSERGLIAYTNVHSCGTETAVSVPCMFSDMGRKGYSAATAKRQEGLLDVLKRAGLNVIWWDNQSGCKGTCDRVTQVNISQSQQPGLCADRECRDEVLLEGLQHLIDTLDRDTVLVLHQMGSHGPDYFKRYPPAFEAFAPVCKSNALDQCGRDSIVNAYDNTVLYTDHVLAQLIDTLRSHQAQVDTAMIYLSDHGESLGEYNLFLHGTPYVLAPEQQTHIPMLAWFSDTYQRSFALDTTCLQAARDTSLSHDNLFHSMLGLLSVQTQTYRPSLDIFAGCRKLPTADRLAGKA